jgi:hypothetical protein
MGGRNRAVQYDGLPYKREQKPSQVIYSESLSALMASLH